MVDWRKFQINSNMPTDEVVVSIQRTISGTNGTFSADVPNPLSFAPLPFGLFSIDAKAIGKRSAISTKNEPIRMIVAIVFAST